MYSVAHFPGSLPAWSAYTDSQGARLLLPSPGRSPFVLDAARATDPEGAAAYLATTSSPSNPGCLAVRQLKNGTQGAVWVAPVSPGRPCTGAGGASRGRAGAVWCLARGRRLGRC